MAWGRRTGSDKLPSHNHDYSSGFDRKSVDCPRCKINAATTGQAIHTCSHGGAFGRRDPQCERCQQLTEGINVATATGSKIAGMRRAEEIRIKAIRAHQCSRSNCGPVCTAFDW
jgi:hypothetical protein